VKAYSSSLKMEATYSSEISVGFQRTMRRYIPGDWTLHNHRCDNLKYYIVAQWLNSVFRRLLLYSVYWHQDTQLIPVWLQLRVLNSLFIRDCSGRLTLSGVHTEYDRNIRNMAVQHYHSIRHKCHYQRFKVYTCICQFSWSLPLVCGQVGLVESPSNLLTL
jgi:hypothetical protein